MSKADLIDWTQVISLRDEVGADDFDEVVALFLEEVDTSIDTLAKHNAHDDLGAALHALKGSALNLGFQSFAKLCSDGETATASQPGHTVDIPAIVALYRQSRETFVADLEAQTGARIETLD